MIVGIDIGSTTTDAIAMEGGNVIKTVSVKSSDAVTSAAGALGKLLNSLKKQLSDIERIAVTGRGANQLESSLLGIKVEKVREIIAIGVGGTLLADKKRALVISTGTGTCMVSVDRNGEEKIRHVGGTGVGGGTLFGLSKLMLDVSSLDRIVKLAGEGDVSKIDLSVRDIVGGPVGIVPADATASNFGKIEDDAKDEDKSLAILNMIGEVIGVVGAYAAMAYKHKDIIVTGKLVEMKTIGNTIKKVGDMHKLNVTIPEYAGYATAIGAAFHIQKKD